MKQTATAVVLLAALWAALSGHYTFEPLRNALGGHFDNELLIPAFGLASIALVAYLAWRMDREAGGAGLPPSLLGLLLRSPAYALYLFLQIVQANLHVTRLVIDPRRMRPRLIRVRARQRSEIGRVIYANSITLTPGTVTLDLRGDELLVHALDEVSAGSVVSGDMDRAVRRYEGSR